MGTSPKREEKHYCLSYLNNNDDDDDDYNDDLKVNVEREAFAERKMNRNGFGRKWDCPVKFSTEEFAWRH
jgi:hypothetical protein